MLRGLYASAAAMLGEQVRLDVVANNLANSSTPGYKRDSAVFQSFERMLVARIGDPADGLPAAGWPGGGLAAARPPFPAGLGAAPLGRLGTGSFVERIQPRLEPGPSVATGRAGDVSLDGPGFFAVQTPTGTRYVRTLRLGRALRLPDGSRALGVDGPFPDDVEDFVIDPQGEVRSGGRAVGRLAVVRFPNPEALRKEGPTVFSATPAAGAPAPAPTPLRVGALEGSNAEPVREMVEMIAVMRAYEANQRSFQLQDATLDKAVNEVGRV